MNASIDYIRAQGTQASVFVPDLMLEGSRGVFIDLFNTAAGPYGKYDPANAPDPEHPFYLNELWLTYEEAIEVYNAGKTQGYYGKEWYTRNRRIRTNLPSTGSYSFAEMDRAFLQCDKLETCNMNMARLSTNTFAYCSKLRRLVGVCQGSLRMENCFYRCFLLEEIDDLSLKYNANLSFSDSPLLNLPSFQRIVTKASNTATITLTVHPDVYTKLIDEANTDWHKVLTDAIAKNIQFASA